MNLNTSSMLCSKISLGVKIVVFSAIIGISSCQKSNSSSNSNPSKPIDTANSGSNFKISLLNNHFWTSPKSPDYFMGLRFFNDSFSYSFVGRIYPSFVYDSVFDKWKLRAPDTLDLGRVGYTELLTLTDSMFTIRNFGDTTIYDFYKIF